MDCARFVEENGTLENQMGALSGEGERERERERVEKRLSYTPPLILGIYGTVTRTGISRSKKSGFPLAYGDRVRFEIRSHEQTLR